MEQPPPPPPPHGTNPGQGGGKAGGRAGGLPDGRYDIFVVPPHSSGSGFLYLPSLQTQRNSFLAGCFCTAASFFLYTTAVPVVKEWLISTVNGGGGGVFLLICGVAVVAWAFGKTQGEWSYNDTDSGSRPGQGPGAHSRPAPSGYANSGPAPGQPPPPPNHGGNAPPPNPGTSAPPPHSSWQRPQPQANTKANTTNAKSSWEKAREETRKREEERKRAEELKKRKEELEKERQKQREKDTLERLERERREKKDKDDKANASAQLEKEKLRQAAEQTRAKAEAEARDRTEAPSTPRRPPMPSAATEREDDNYSFRPYDRPRRAHKANSAASMYSESSYAPSVSTARTTPPPTARGPYSTTDPDKIIIKGVFSFNNAFTRTPISQLVSNQGQVSDGLILRITTEGLFIDDDVRGVPQREWDVKAWTMKLAEVWCPNYSPGKKSQGKSKFTLGLGGDSKASPSPWPSETNAFVTELLSHCVNECRVPGTRGSFFSTHSASNDDTDNSEPQSCEIGGMHILRASIRDVEGRRFVFILSQSEGWKVAVGLQRLRRGKQVQAFGVAGLPQNEAKAILHNLGFG